MFIDNGSTWFNVLSDAAYARARAKNPAALRVRHRSFQWFANIVSTSHTTLDPEHSDVRILTDGTIASVYFNFVFLIDGKPENQGSETWQLLKTSDGWKIAAITYSSNPPRRDTRATAAPSFSPAARRRELRESCAQLPQPRRFAKHPVHLWHIILRTRLLAPAGQQDDGRTRCERAHGSSDLPAIDVRHSEIREHDFERLGTLLGSAEEIDALLAATGERHPMALVLQRVSQGVTQRRIIVHDEYA